MSEIAVEVNHVWKKFRRGELHDSLRDLVPALAKRLVGRGPKPDELCEGDFWALRDVSFQVKRGEVLGIIGPNGSGKSTLLKVLSKIIKPTKGSMYVDGRLRALIEVAAGFHGDLTGRENVFLNGALLGMSKREIDAKFDEIVDFSGIEPFLDTPVKRYSSGMHARLGFAVAAHLEPEVLIVDEVLAVGDAEFQKRCLGKMDDVARSGRTVIFVSHNIQAVETLCGRCAHLEKGQVKYIGATRDAIADYQSGYAHVRGDLIGRAIGHDPGNGDPAIRRVWLTDASGVPLKAVPMGAGLSVHVGYSGPAHYTRPVLGVQVRNAGGAPVFGVSTRFIPGFSFRDAPAMGTISCTFESLPLMPGSYLIDLYLGDSCRDYHVIAGAAILEIVRKDIYGSGQLPPTCAGDVFWHATFSVSSANGNGKPEGLNHA